MKDAVNGRKFWGGAGIAALMLVAQVAGAGEFSAPDIEVDEGDEAIFEVTLPDTYDFAVRFRYETQDGSAEAGKHYIARQNHLVFNAGTQSAQVKVRTTTVVSAFADEDFKLVLSERQVKYNNSWSGAFAIIWIPDVPQSKTIRAVIRNTTIPKDEGA